MGRVLGFGEVQMRQIQGQNTTKMDFAWEDNKIPNRIKEWAYAGFAFDFIFACISYASVDGFGGQTFFPLIVFAILITSYISYEKLKQYRNQSKIAFKTNNQVEEFIYKLSDQQQDDNEPLTSV